jgi:hypothetical protein
VRAVQVAALAGALLGGVLLAAQPSSKWVFTASDGRLRYRADARGNRIMDFSHAGYRGGGVRLPNVPVARRVDVAAGDSTARIQGAIDEVSRLEPGPGGLRGAVQLEPGTFEIAGQLRIASSGVVLRGSGSGDRGTTLTVVGPPRRLLEISGAGTWEAAGGPASITDSYVPSGAVSFALASSAGFAKGDRILVRRAVTAAWIRFMGMDTLARDGKPQTWIVPGTLIITDRTIAAVAGRRVTLDVPLSDSIDAQYLTPPGASIVKYRFPGRIEQVGVESLRVTVPARDVPISQAQYSLLRVSAVSDGWVRDVVAEDTQNSITIANTVRRMTLEDVHIRHAVPFTGAASPADFAVSGTQILVHRSSVSGRGIWPVVTQAGVTGPNVILRFRSEEAGVAPHQRWATGLLVDSSEFSTGTERRPNVAFSNREHAGSGHGWSIGWGVAWNVKAEYLLIQQPPGAKNWCIGCTGRPATILWHGNPIRVPEIPSETFESPNAPVAPPSLYEAQLRDRLGTRALDAIGR